MILQKRILYIQKPPGGGSLIALYEMVRILDRQQFEPIIFCYELNEHTALLKKLDAKVIYNSGFVDHKNSGKAQPVSRLRRAIKPLRKVKAVLVDDYKMAAVIEKIIAENNIDIIHHNCDFPFIRQGILANRKLKLPQVCHYRSLQPYRKFSFDWFIDKALVKKIDYHIYISQAVKSHFKKYLGIQSNNELVLRDIIDVNKFQPKPASPEIFRSLKLKESDVVISCIGRLLQWKGQHIFIEAFAEVAKHVPNARALVVGPYDKGVGDYEYYLRLQNMVAEYGLTDKVIFTGNRSDIENIFAVSHCIVHSSVSAEPQGLVIVEALFSNIPVVVSDSGGAGELIVNNEGGLKVPPANAKAMAKAICTILESAVANSPKLKPSILSEFIPGKQIKVIEKIYESLSPAGFN